MFHVNQELYRIIEDIQRKAIISLGANPEEIAIRNAKKNKTDFLEKENWEEHYAEMTIKDFYMMMPEHPYDTSLEYFKYTRLCRVTKFDQPGFLRRFANITSLCHEFYTQANRRPKKNIIVTTLPYLNMNGVCMKYSDDTDVVFINEGLLSVIPKIYKHLLPLFNPQLFGFGTENQNVNKIMDILTQACFFKNSYNDLSEIRDIQYPHAHESWYFDELDRRNLANTFSGKTSHEHDEQNENDILVEHPSSFPLNKKIAHFLACRGAFIFLLGHEFSHAYNDHCNLRFLDDVDFRDPEFVDDLFQEFEDEISRFQIDSNDLRYFFVNQPIEEEADAHGLGCVLKYCYDNKLDDQKSSCVVIGAIATLIIMEMHECLSIIHGIGSKKAEIFFAHDPMLRNLLYREEHPTPITRLNMALRHMDFQNYPGMPALKVMNQGLVKLGNEICSRLLPVAPEIEKFLASADLLSVDFNDLFDHHLCLGISDFSKRFYSKISM